MAIPQRVSYFVQAVNRYLLQSCLSLVGCHQEPVGQRLGRPRSYLRRQLYRAAPSAAGTRNDQSLVCLLRLKDSIKKLKDVEILLKNMLTGKIFLICGSYIQQTILYPHDTVVYR